MNRVPSSVAAALLCAAVALLSYLALVAYDAGSPMPFWQ
jgi:hypothetical protein